MDKKKSIAKAACRSSKKDGKGGPLGDGVKAVAGAVSDKVKQVGDMRVRDAVSGVSNAISLPGRVVGGALRGGAAGAVSGAKRGIDNALGRGQGKKKGLLKKQLKPMIKPMLPEIRMAPAVMPRMAPAVMPNNPPKQPLPTTAPLPPKSSGAISPEEMMKRKQADQSSRMRPM